MTDFIATVFGDNPARTIILIGIGWMIGALGRRLHGLLGDLQWWIHLRAQGELLRNAAEANRLRWDEEDRTRSALRSDYRIGSRQ